VTHLMDSLACLEVYDPSAKKAGDTVVIKIVELLALIIHEGNFKSN